MSILEQSQILQNQNTFVEPKKAADIYNNKDNLKFAPKFYLKNPEVYDNEMKQNKMKEVAQEANDYKGLTASLANASIYSIVDPQKDVIKAQEDAAKGVLDQRIYDQKNWFSKLWQFTAQNYIGINISSNEYKLAHDNLSYDERYKIQQEIEADKKKLTNIQASQAIQSIGGFAGSMAAMGPTAMLAGAIGGVAGGVIGGVKGASVGSRAASAYAVYDQSIRSQWKSIDDMVYNMNPGLSEEEHKSYVDTINRFEAIVETAGWSFGAGGLGVKTVNAAISKFGLEKVLKTVTAKSFSLTRFLAQATASGFSEALEEMIQNTSEEVAEGKIKSGADLNIADLAKDTYAATADWAKRMATGEYTNEDLDKAEKLGWDTVAGMMLGAVFEGGTAAFNNIQERQEKAAEATKNQKLTEQYKNARKENTIKNDAPAADREVTRNIVSANDLGKGISLPEDVVVGLIEEGNNGNEAIADAVNKLHLQERLEKSIDGKVAVDLEDANAVIFDPDDETLYQRLKDSITWNPQDMSKGEFDIFVKSLSKETTPEDVKVIQDIAKKLEPTVGKDRAYQDAVIANNIANALSRADTRKTKNEWLNEINNHIINADVEGIADSFDDSVSVTKTPIQKAVKKVKKAVKKVKGKISPTVFDEESDLSEIEEREGEFVRLASKKVPVEYEIVDARDLLTSNDETGKVNKSYPQYLQNRDRSRKELVMQVQKISESIEPERLGKNVVATEGAPIVTRGNVVAIGNGRATALKSAYTKGKAEEYRAYLQSQGFNVGGIEQPVLIRRLTADYQESTMRTLIEEANVSGTSQFSLSEQAIGDSQKINPDTFSLYNSGSALDSAENRPFVQKMFNEIVPETEQGRYLDDEGRITSEGVKRIKYASLSYVLPDKRLLSSILESEDEVINKASNAIMESSPNIVSFETDIEKGKIAKEYSIVEDLRVAFSLYNRAKKSGQNVRTYIKNLDMFQSYTDAQKELTNWFVETKNSGELSNRIKKYIESAKQEGDLQQDSMFGQSLSKDEIIGSLSNKKGTLFQRSFDSDNTYYQSAFHGTPFSELEGGKSKLEKIGAGEIFNPDDVKVIQKFYQQSSVGIAGTFDPQTLMMRLTREQNPTTFAHELYHFFMNRLLDAYTANQTNDYWTKQVNVAMKFAGAVKGEDGRYAWTSHEAEVRGQEKLADGFTEYLLHGKSPNERLTGFFEAMKQWFMTVYKAMRHVRLSKAITSFYDNIFMTDEEVATTMTDERVGAFERPKDATDEQWNEYLDTKRKAAGEATSASIRAAELMAQKQGEGAYKEKYNEYYNQEYEELRADPKHVCRDDIKINPDSLNGVTDIELKGEFKSKANGVDARLAARTYGFDSVSDMVLYMNETERSDNIADRVAKERADAWLLEQYPELQEIKAKNAIRNIAMIKTLVYEAMMLQGIPLDRFNLNFNELIKSSEDILQNMELREAVNADKLANRLNNLNQKIITMERLGKKKELGRLRWRSAIMNYMMLRAKAVRAKSNRFNKHFEKYGRAQTPVQAKRIEGNVWDMIHAALFNYGYTAKEPANKKNLVERIEEYVNSLQYTKADEINATSYFLTNPDGVSRKALSVKDFDTLDGALRLLEGVSKANLAYVQEDKIRTFAEDVDMVIEHLDKNNVKQWGLDDRFKNFLLGTVAMKETLLSRIFPKQIFARYVLPFMNGLTKQNAWIEEKGKILGDLIKPVIEKRNKEFRIDGKVYTYEQLLVIMLNVGNEHNRACIAKTYGLDDTALQSVIDQAPKELRQIAQGVWDVFEENAQTFKEVQSRLTGVELKMVEPSVVTFSDGETLRGGYYPANKKTFDKKTDFLIDKESLNTDTTFPTFSFQKERTLQVHGELDTTTRSLEAWLYKMGAVINVAEPYTDLAKIINNKRIVERLGDGAQRAFANWMKGAIMPEQVDKFVAAFDAVASTKILGWKPVKAIVQSSGIIPALVEIGPRVAFEAGMLLANPVRMLTLFHEAKKLSPYMMDRYSNPQNHLADVRRMSVFGNYTIKKGLEKYTYLGMIFTSYGDAIASVPTWKASYAQAINNGMSEADAQMLADSAVRRIQGDTTSGSRPPLLQGNSRFFSKFASYFIGINSMLSADAYYGNKLHAIAILAAAGVFAPVYESIFGGLYDWMTADDEKRKKWRKRGLRSAEEYIKQRAESNIKSSTASSIFPAYGLGMRISQYLDYDQAYTPEFNALTSMVDFATLPIDAYRLFNEGNEKSKEKRLERIYKKVLGTMGSDYISLKDTYRMLGDIANVHS